MKRIALLLVALSSTVSMGCATCCAPFDYAYPTYGGKYERADRFHGRVGSAFNDASGMMTSGEEYYDEGTMIDSEGEVIDDQQ